MTIYSVGNCCQAPETQAELLKSRITSTTTETISFDAVLFNIETSRASYATDKIAKKEDGDAGSVGELFNLIHKLTSDSFNALMNIGAKDGVEHSSRAESAGEATDATIAEWLNNDGPLPKFINMVISERHLTVEQQLSLKRIAYNHRDDNKTPQTVQTIADELAAAGIA